MSEKLQVSLSQDFSETLSDPISNWPAENEYYIPPEVIELICSELKTRLVIELSISNLTFAGFNDKDVRLQDTYAHLRARLHSALDIGIDYFLDPAGKNASSAVMNMLFNTWLDAIVKDYRNECPPK